MLFATHTLHCDLYCTLCLRSPHAINMQVQVETTFLGQENTVAMVSWGTVGLEMLAVLILRQCGDFDKLDTRLRVEGRVMVKLILVHMFNT